MRSDITKKDPTFCPPQPVPCHGLHNEELQRPMIGVVNSFNEIVPGHMHLREIADAVKMGVAEAGGMPVEFPAIAICDGIAMGHDGMKYPLASRELIADSIEAVANGHAFDGLVMIPNCDKIVPGMLMAAGRLNIPTVVVSGGPCLPAAGKGATSVSAPCLKRPENLKPANYRPMKWKPWNSEPARAAAPAPAYLQQIP